MNKRIKKSGNRTIKKKEIKKHVLHGKLNRSYRRINKKKINSPNVKLKYKGGAGEGNNENESSTDDPKPPAPVEEPKEGEPTEQTNPQENQPAEEQENPAAKGLELEKPGETNEEELPEGAKTTEEGEQTTTEGAAEVEKTTAEGEKTTEEGVVPPTEGAAEGEAPPTEEVATEGTAPVATAEGEAPPTEGAVPPAAEGEKKTEEGATTTTTEGTVPPAATAEGEAPPTEGAVPPAVAPAEGAKTEGVAEGVVPATEGVAPPAAAAAEGAATEGAATTTTAAEGVVTEGAAAEGEEEKKKQNIIIGPDGKPILKLEEPESPVKEKKPNIFKRAYKKTSNTWQNIRSGRTKEYFKNKTLKAWNNTKQKSSNLWQATKKKSSNLYDAAKTKTKNALQDTWEYATGKPTDSKWTRTWKSISAPIRLPFKAAFYTGKKLLWRPAVETYKGTKYLQMQTGILLGKIGNPLNPLINAKNRYLNWRATSASVNSELKRIKYNDKLNLINDELGQKNQEIAELQNQIGFEQDDNKKKELARKLSTLESEQSKLLKRQTTASIKVAEWNSKSSSAQTNLKNLQQTRLNKVNMNKVNSSLQVQENAFNKFKEKQESQFVKEKSLSILKELETNPDLNKAREKYNQEAENKLQNYSNTIPVGTPNRDAMIANQRQLLMQQANSQYINQRGQMETDLMAQARQQFNERMQLQKSNIYKNQIAKIANKIGISTDILNDTATISTLNQRYSQMGNQPIKGPELAKILTETAFGKAKSNAQFQKLAKEYTTAPSMPFTPDDVDAGIESLGNKTAKEQFYQNYTNNFMEKVQDLLKEENYKNLNPGQQNQLRTLQNKIKYVKQKRNMTDSQRSQFLYNVFKDQNYENLTNVRASQQINNISQVKKKLETDPNLLNQAADAYYNEMINKYSQSPKGLNVLASLYDKDYAKYLKSRTKKTATEQNSKMLAGLKKYRENLPQELITNPQAIQAIDQNLFNQIVQGQQIDARQTPKILSTLKAENRSRKLEALSKSRAEQKLKSEQSATVSSASSGNNKPTATASGNTPSATASGNTPSATASGNNKPAAKASGNTPAATASSGNTPSATASGNNKPAAKASNLTSDINIVYDIFVNNSNLQIEPGNKSDIFNLAIEKAQNVKDLYINGKINYEAIGRLLIFAMKQYDVNIEELGKNMQKIRPLLKSLSS